MKIRTDNLKYKNIFYYESIDSTNKEAKRNTNAPDGSVFIAEHQTEGRGRMGRVWDSESGCGIWMSILLKPHIQNISCITLAAGLAVCNSIRKTGLDAYIKWPNDIVVNNKKICGILAESIIDKNNIYCVVGIGVNVNTSEFPDELKGKATSYFIENGKEYDRAKLLEIILEDVEKTLDVFYENGIESIIGEYKKLCVTLDKEVLVLTPEGEYNAYAKDITQSGELIVEKDGKTSTVNSGEVSVRGILGYI